MIQVKPFFYSHIDRLKLLRPSLRKYCHTSQRNKKWRQSVQVDALKEKVQTGFYVLTYKDDNLYFVFKFCLKLQVLDFKLIFVYMIHTNPGGGYYLIAEVYHYTSNSYPYCLRADFELFQRGDMSIFQNWIIEAKIHNILEKFTVLF